MNFQWNFIDSLDVNTLCFNRKIQSGQSQISHVLLNYYKIQLILKCLYMVKEELNFEVKYTVKIINYLLNIIVKIYIFLEN